MGALPNLVLVVKGPLEPNGSDDLRIHLVTGEAARGWAKVLFGPLQKRIVLALASRGFMPRLDLACTVYADQEDGGPVTPYRSFDTLFCQKLRLRLGKLGLVVSTRRGMGYDLALVEEN